MFQRILVALDNSEMSQRVFEEGLSIAKVTHAHLMLLHVLSDLELGYANAKNLDEHLDKWEEYRKKGLELLQSRQNIATYTGVDTGFTQIVGSAPSTICKLAQSWKADLIVVGHQRKSPLQELALGSVSNYVMHYAPCSVLTIQPT
ncbi:MAG: universal stress protein [Chlorogloeopsis fritschii C42_A2020_084]|uniref:universal stress protein n=1 Tax=Chlorogloeopsis fritschii TaxID=1124 RepID=UPI001A00B5C0|nr:universal stress protein [Chlorogloeopsis fritschii]MBF2004882.1 universal stress protein [Chlorogloeopsis fritschii C42_A2020_084]